MQEEYALRRQRQHGKVIGKVCRKKEDEQNLAELRRLHGKRTEYKPVLIPPDTHSKEKRQEENDRRRNTQHIGIVEETPQTLPQEHHSSPEDDADTRPAQLRGEQLRLQARDLRKAYGKQHVGEAERNTVKLSLQRDHIAGGSACEEEKEPRQIRRIRVPVKQPAGLSGPFLQQENAKCAEEEADRRDFQSLCHDAS